MARLQNRVVVITGGTTGIGLAAAKLFAAEGARVTVTGTNPKSIEAAKRELGPTAEVVASDASSSTDVQALARTFGEQGGVDVLFLNAGIAKLGELTTLDEAVFDDVIRINVRGPWLGIKYFAPVMHRGGAVVVTSSVNDQLGLAGSGAYAASKAAVRALVRVAAAELVGAGVRVNAVSPGPVETPLHAKFGLPAETMKSFADGLLSQIPMKRFGRPEEVARAALFLASDDSSYMTGEEIVLDGGMTTI